MIESKTEADTEKKTSNSRNYFVNVIYCVEKLMYMIKYIKVRTEYNIHS